MSFAPPVGACRAFCAAVLQARPSSLRTPPTSRSASSSRSCGSATREDYSRGFMVGAVTCSNNLASTMWPVDGHTSITFCRGVKNVRDMETVPILVMSSPKRARLWPAEAFRDSITPRQFDFRPAAQARPSRRSRLHTWFSKSRQGSPERHKIFGITAAMPSGTGSDIFAKAFPERNLRVASPSTRRDLSAGLATAGYYKAVLRDLFDFCARLYIVHGRGIPGLRLALPRSIAPAWSRRRATHAGSFSHAYLGCLPGLVTWLPSDEAELAHMADPGPINDRPDRTALSAREGRGVEMPEFGFPRIAKGASSASSLSISLSRWALLQCRIA